jgi:hypothetical protein
MRVAFLLTLVLIALRGLAGCVDQTPHRSFVPAPNAARGALDAVLSQWAAGKPPTYRNDLSPAVGVVDNQRMAGQRLERYEVLGEVPSRDGRCFAVKLHLAGPDAVEQVRFVVVGIDPLWVFRYEDFDLLSHWDHDMTEEAPEQQTPESSAGSTEERATDAPREEPSLTDERIPDEGAP